MTERLPYWQWEAILFPVNQICQLIYISLLPASFLSIPFFFSYPLPTPCFVCFCVSARLFLGSDSAQKAGLQPYHVSLWLQRQYQTCPWRWQCKYWSCWSHTVERVDSNFSVCSLSAVILQKALKNNMPFGWQCLVKSYPFIYCHVFFWATHKS